MPQEDKMKLKKSFIILFMMPLVILTAGYGMVKILNRSAAQGDRFSIRLDREILFPWQDYAVAGIHLDFSGEGFIRKSLEKTDIVLVLDNSPSMADKVGQGTKSDIVRDVILEFIDNFESGGNVRIGAILFDRGITRKMPLDNQTGDLRDLVLSCDTFGEGTDFAPALELAGEWLKNSPAAKKYIVFLTDGEPNQEVDHSRPNRIYLETLQPNRVEVFMVGVGEQVPFNILRDVIKDKKGEFDPNRVLTCRDPLKLQILFDEVGEKIGNVIGRQGRLTIPLADHAFSPVQAVPPAIRQKYSHVRIMLPLHPQSTPFTLHYPVVFSRLYPGFAPLKPETPGIIKPFYHNLRFSYLDIDNVTKNLESSSTPYLLNITYGTLFWLYLPLLFYLVLSLLGRKTVESVQREKIVIPLNKHQTPGTIPKKYHPAKSRLEWIPTLAIGLGKTGRHVLTHLKQNLSDTTSAESEHIQLLGIDVAESETRGPQPDRVPGVLVQLDPQNEIYVPDAHLRNVTGIIRQYENCTVIDAEDPFSTLELWEFAALPESITGLDNGAHHHAGLARAYLFKELELGEQSPLVQILESKLSRLRQCSASRQYVQIIIAANTNGGTGAGLLLPLAVLLRRMLERDKAPGTSAEIHLVLVEDRENPRKEETVPIRNRMLLDELDLFSQAGRIPFPYHLVSKHNEDKKNILKGIVTQRPYNNIQVFAQETSAPCFDLYPQVADGLLFLVERSARIESRPIFDGVRKKEGELRRQEKSEIFTHVTCRSLLYPVGLIRQWLKYMFIKDIFSPKVALGGFSAVNDTFEIDQKGSVEQLFRHPLIAPLLKIEAGGEKNKWVSLFLNEKIDLGPGPIAPDTENFWSYLEKAVPLLLNHHVFTLPGLHSALGQMKRKTVELEIRQRNEQNASYITKNIAFLDSFAHSLGDWLDMLLGSKEKKGLIQELYALIKQIETLQRELQAMDKCRIVLGVDKNTPKTFRLDNLKESWLCRWLGTGQPGNEDKNASYSELKKRCLWKTVEDGTARPVLRFEIYGHQHHIFAGDPHFLNSFLEAADALSGQFLNQVKEITILELLAAYEKNLPEMYGKPNVAGKLHGSFQSRNLLYMFMLPHHLSVRLGPEETKYAARLKEEITRAMRIEEISCFPQTSNTYRLYALQVSTLLRGDNRDTRDGVTPFHMVGKLALGTRKLCEHTFGFTLPYALPFHYLALAYPQQFCSFTRLWLGGMIVVDDYDGLWTLHIDGQSYKLTHLAGEGIEEAAARYVMNHRELPTAPAGIIPETQRLKYMNEQVKERNPIFCWMKLYYVENQP
jgi:hypothetical protein